MDRIIQNYLNDFLEKSSLPDSLNQSEKFEHFVNYTLIEPRVEESFEIEDLNISEKGTIGIDGFAILVDKKLFVDYSTLKEYLDNSSKDSIVAEIYFIQSKTSAKFEIKEILSFGRAVQDFISSQRTLIWSEIAKESMELFDLIFNYSTKFKENPICYLYYTSLGNYNGDLNQESCKDRTIEDIRRENLFSNIYFEFIDIHKLQSKYKKLGQVLQKSIEFEQRLTIPTINNVKESYIGIIKAKEIIHLISDDNGGIIPNVFYDKYPFENSLCYFY